MKITETLRKLIKNLINQNKTKILGSLLRKALEIDTKDYKEFNRTKRTPVQEITLDSLLDAIDKTQAEELNSDAKNSLENFPKLEQIANDIDSQSEESKLIQTFKDVQIEENSIKFDDPTDLLSTLLKMSFDDHVLHNFLRFELGLRDQQDYNEIKRSFFGPLHGVLKESFGEKFKDALYLSVFQLSRLYGIPPIKNINPVGVYTGAYPFYKGHESESTITLSTSSGLPNPLERFGTDEFRRKYSVDSDDVGDLLLKNAYRKDNFSKGILNKKIRSKRIYIWEKDGTSNALKKALEKVPLKRKQKFLDDAVNLLTKALMFDNIKIIEIEKFDDWMKRFTRNAKGEIMFSIRGTESKRISHAIHINFNIESMRKRSQFVQRMLNILAIGGAVHQKAGLAVLLLVWGEDLAYSLVESTLGKPFKLEKQLMEVGTMIKDFGSTDKKKAQNKSQKVIEDLMK
jgi:hypothetical protein